MNRRREARNEPAEVASTYGRVATRYAETFGDELRTKPLDRALLDLFCEELRGRGGRVADLGTGSGHVARHLHDRGLHVIGVDLSPEMVIEARARNPGVDFAVGDLCRLPAPDGAWAGATAFYAIVHLTRAELPAVFAEVRRVLSRGAPLLVGFHAGDEAVRPEEFLGVAPEITWNFFPPAAVTTAITMAGLAVEAEVVRAPYPAEHPSMRAYVMARRKE